MTEPQPVRQSETSDRPDYRVEMYGDESGQPPFWVSVEDEHGHERDAAEALALVSGFVGPFDDAITIAPVVGGVEWTDLGWWFRKGMEHGRLHFWEVDDA